MPTIQEAPPTPQPAERSDQTAEHLMLVSAEANIPKYEDEPSQDAVLNRPDLAAFGVFDGLGGYVGGREAAELARQKSIEMYEHVNSELTDEQKGDPKVQATAAKVALEQANKAILDKQKEDPQFKEMSTVSTIGHIFKTSEGALMLAYAHAGDTRLGIFRDNKITFITTDECKEPPEGHIVTNSLGQEKAIIKQSGIVGLQPEDRIVIFSDGISGDTPRQFLTDKQYQDALATKYSPEEAVSNLVKTSKKRDDKGVVVIDVRTDEATIKGKQLAEETENFLKNEYRKSLEAKAKGRIPIGRDFVRLTPGLNDSYRGPVRLKNGQTVQVRGTTGEVGGIRYYQTDQGVKTELQFDMPRLRDPEEVDKKNKKKAYEDRKTNRAAKKAVEPAPDTPPAPKVKVQPNELLTDDYQGPALIATKGRDKLTPVTLTGVVHTRGGERFFGVEGGNKAVSEKRLVLGQNLSEKPAPFNNSAALEQFQTDMEQRRQRELP